MTLLAAATGLGYAVGSAVAGRLADAHGHLGAFSVTVVAGGPGRSLLAGGAQPACAGWGAGPTRQPGEPGTAEGEVGRPATATAREPWVCHADAMTAVATVLVALVALIHVYIVVLEMFLWTDPAWPGGLRPHPRVRRADQGAGRQPGLYNGFLAAGLVWGLVGPDHLRFGFQVFFLLCVDGRRALRRGDRQPQDPVRPGPPGHPGPGRRAPRPLTPGLTLHRAGRLTSP